jgi:signal peptidase
MPASATPPTPTGGRPGLGDPRRHGRRAADGDVRVWTALTWGSARFAIVAVGTMLALVLVPAALGCRAVVVVSGSMHPSVWVGDVLVARPLGTQLPRRGQVLLVDDPAHPGRLLSHRLIRVNPDGTLMVKGDANTTADSTPVPRSAVHGVAVLRVPLIGHPTIWRAEGRSLPLAATTLLALSTGWIGLRPPPRGTGSQHRPARTARAGTPRPRHRKTSEPGHRIEPPTTTGVGIAPKPVHAIRPRSVADRTIATATRR